MGIPLELILPQDTSIRFRGGEGTPAPATTPTTTSETTSGTTSQTQPPAPGAGADPMSGCYSQLPIFAAFGLIFYFLILRPQRKQEKQRRELLAKIGRGDKVVTNSGIHGVIAGIADDTVQLRIDSEGKVKITVDRSAIGRVVPDDAAAKSTVAVKEAAKE